MNICRRKPLKVITLAGSLLLSGFIISSCGGGSSQSAGIGGTGISTARGYVQGKVTGFGSIYVNGKKFNTDSSEFYVDGNPDGTQDDLAVGMIVTLGVEISDGVYTGKALEVFYDDEVQGPVASLPVDIGGGQKTFMVFGQTVTIDQNETLFEKTTFDTLNVDDVVEISGFRSSSTEIFATYIEWKETLENDSEVELRGTISGYKPPTQQFMLDGFLITFDDNTDIEIEAGNLADGLYVEVKGRYQTTVPPLVQADQIEQEVEGLGDDVDEVSLQGPISDYMGIGDFKINGQQVDASQASLSPGNVLALLGNGLEVEVEGDIVGGVLMAVELELEEIEARLQGFVTPMPGETERFEVTFKGMAGPGAVEIVTNVETEFEDNGPLKMPNFSVAEMKADDFVVVEGVESAGKVTAGKVERLDLADRDDSELQGQVDSFARNALITVLGVSFRVDAGTITKYEDGSGAISAVKFFDKLSTGDRVEIRDKDPEDGTADEVKLDD